MISFKRQKKILVPTDFSPQADQAVIDALDMVADPSDLSVLHVAPPMSSYPVADPAIVWENITEHARAERIEDSYRQHIKDPRASAVHFAVRFGAPAEEVVDYAEEHKIDMIMMPSHGRSGLKRLLLGSVAERVVRAAHCPVIVLRN
ncbi:putative universal stress protein [Posidoniimonas polymericola]|uniref:Putative universal stress protein n=1 Tax=Posidoniimonas polymericola TaxID=2528002 RepID=A0A5C5YHT3_9BACT|nr:universal stress protein [Posidoniimonas polymericola]TWT74551.1 putative universal stress protein [Posidoniimonas polymericola]